MSFLYFAIPPANFVPKDESEYIYETLSSPLPKVKTRTKEKRILIFH